MIFTELTKIVSLPNEQIIDEMIEYFINAIYEKYSKRNFRLRVEIIAFYIKKTRETLALSRKKLFENIHRLSQSVYNFYL